MAAAAIRSVNQGLPNQIAAIRRGRPMIAVNSLCLSMLVPQALVLQSGGDNGP